MGIDVRQGCGVDQDSWEFVEETQVQCPFWSPSQKKSTASRESLVFLSPLPSLALPDGSFSPHHSPSLSSLLFSPSFFLSHFYPLSLSFLLGARLYHMVKWHQTKPQVRIPLASTFYLKI